MWRKNRPGRGVIYCIVWVGIVLAGEAAAPEYSNMRCNIEPNTCQGHSSVCVGRYSCIRCSGSSARQIESACVHCPYRNCTVVATIDCGNNVLGICRNGICSAPFMPLGTPCSIGRCSGAGPNQEKCDGESDPPLP